MESSFEIATRRNRLPVGALLTANIISLVGSMLTFVALPWFVLQTTGSAARTGITGAFEVLPAFAAGVLGGALVDRLGYKRVSVSADLVSGIGIGLIPLLYHTIGLAYWQLLVFVFFGALLAVPGLTARRSMLPELAGLGGLRLEQVNSAFEAMQALSLLIGPPLAGLLIGVLGTANVLWLDAASFAASAAIVAALVPAARPVLEQSGGETYAGQLVAGLRFLRRDRVLFTLAICLTLSNFLEGSFVSVVLPVYVKDVFGQPTVLGLLAATFGAGALSGALFYGVAGHRLPRRGIWIAGYLAAALPLWALLATHTLSVIMGAAAISGLLSGPLNPLLVTVRHERIPLELRGRVFSTFSALATGAQPLGMVVVGGAIQGFGLTGTMLVLGLFIQVLGISMFFVPALREMERSRAGRTEPVAVEM